MLLYSFPNDVLEHPIVVTVRKARKQYILMGILRSKNYCYETHFNKIISPEFCLN